MNKKPIFYLQTDPRWAKKPYQVPGETATIGGSGCGPSCAAMLIETLTGHTYTPEDACAWSLKHGFKALKQGTYYGYFKPQFEAFGIDCEMLSWQSSYGKPNHDNHKKAFELLQQGFYIIALMGKGLWTSSGHFVVLWWQDGKVRINDPASTKSTRLNGNLETFKAQAKYYWWVDARSHNNKTENEVDEIDIDKLIQSMTDQQAIALADRIDAARGNLPPSDWSKDAREWAEENGILSGDEHGNKKYKKPCSREELVQILFNQK